MNNLCVQSLSDILLLNGMGKLVLVVVKSFSSHKSNNLPIISSFKNIYISHVSANNLEEYFLSTKQNTYAPKVLGLVNNYRWGGSSKVLEYLSPI